MQRDYAILQGTSYRPALEDDLVSELVDGDRDNDDEQDLAGLGENGDDDDVEQGLSASGALESDNMSQLSMPEGATFGGLSTSYDHQQYARGGTRVMAAATSPVLSPSNRRRSWARRTSHAMSTEEQQQHGGKSHIGPIPSAYILGGHPAATTAGDAEARAQFSSGDGQGVDQSANHVAAYRDGHDDSHDDDDDATPMPRHQSAGWLTPAAHHEGASSSSPLADAALETSPLLQAGAQSGYGGTATASISTGASTGNGHHNHTVHRRPSLVGGAASGWDRTAPGLPGQETLDELAHEAAQQPGPRRELAVLLAYSAPIWATHVLELSLNVVSVFSLGHLGTTELAAASLSSMTANVTGFSVLSGFISALDSVLPAAYSHAPKTVGLWTQRAAVISAVLLVPISAIWLASEQILGLLGQEEQVAALASLYLRILVLGLPGYACFEICRRYLQAQGLMHAPTVVLFVASPLNAVLNYLLVWGPPSVRLGFIGAPIASVVSTWLMALLCLLQCYVAPRIAWAGWSRRAFSGLTPLVNLGLAGTLAICSEWWSWEVRVLLLPF